MIFTKILQKMLKLDLILQIMNEIKVTKRKYYKSDWINKRRIRCKKYDKLCWSKTKTL